MGRKRPGGVIDLSSSDCSGYEDFDDIHCSQVPSTDVDFDSLNSVSDGDYENEDDSSSDNASLEKALYAKCLRDYDKIKKLKARLQRSLRHKSKKAKCPKKSTEGFTRFSATAFANVIQSLSPEQKHVIDSYGFGSLLLFDKCFVPNNFAKWVAHLVDSKSGDIIHGGKVISLTEETVNLVIDLPLGTRPFPSDPTAGKKVVLSMFGKDKIPSVSFFADKLIQKEVLSDEEMFICFMVVALSSFLCPNTNPVPSPKYFGVFEDIEHIKDFKWCSYILQWLLHHVKSFNGLKDDKGKRCLGLGGCLYYLAVVYLDHIDFRQRQVSPSIPRISVWKGDMIQFYCNLDMRSPGVYGYRPLLDFEKTCYFKCGRLKSVVCADDLDTVFCERMESVSGCEFPLNLKIKISKLVEKHSFNCGESLNLDLVSLSNVSKEFQECFGRLMRHVCTADSRSKNLIVDVLKAIADSISSSQEGPAPAPCPASPEEAHIDPVIASSVKVSARKVSQSVRVGASQLIDVDLDDKARKRNLETVSQKLDNLYYQNVGGQRKGAGVSVRNPLSDRTNVGSKSAARQEPSHVNDDIILVDKENVVPDSVSPSPVRHRSKLFSSKVSLETPTNSKSTRNEDTFIMHTIPFTDEESPRITPKLSKKPLLFHDSRSSGKKLHLSKPIENDSSPVICTGSRSFSDKVLVQTQKSDAIYNSKMEKSRTAPTLYLNRTHGFPSNSPLDPEGDAGCSDFKSRDSSTGGKLPLHGARRMVWPSRFIGGDFDNGVSNFHVSKSEIDNYKAVCALSSSHKSNLDALYYVGVRCTFWSLGESLKPGGQVNNFVIAAFCYHLFCRPDGHPDVSKRHYFFPNISDIFLKDHDEVDVSVMDKAFTRTGRSRPLHRANMLYFPTVYEDHWFVFVVDLKDHKFFFLDSFYSEDHGYHQYIREKMIPEFVFWWDKFVKFDMRFSEFEVKYPAVPKHSPHDSVDSGVYAMMCLEYWLSPRSSLCSFFGARDIPNIRIKLCNEMLFNPRNTGRKDLVSAFELNEDDADE